MWMMPLHLHVNQKSDYDMMMMMTRKVAASKERVSVAIIPENVQNTKRVQNCTDFQISCNFDKFQILLINSLWLYPIDGYKHNAERY